MIIYLEFYFTLAVIEPLHTEQENSDIKLHIISKSMIARGAVVAEVVGKGGVESVSSGCVRMDMLWSSFLFKAGVGVGSTSS